jgi:hypothetical protein
MTNWAEDELRKILGAAALNQKAGQIRAAGLMKEVVYEPVDGSRNDRIDEAYRVKYRTSSYLGTMIGSQARGATIKVVPRGPKADRKEQDHP